MATVIDMDINYRNDDMFYVYAHIRPDNGSIFYIGKGRKSRAWKVHGRNRHWSSVVAKHGFEVKIIDSGLSEREAFDLEIKKISEIGIENLCNYSLGGEGSSGYKLTEQQKAKHAAALKGRKISDETKAKIGAANTGKIRSDKSKVAMSLSHIGKKRAIESIEKQKRSMIHRAETRKNEIYGRIMKAISCSNGLRFNSLSEAAEWMKEKEGIATSKSAIARCASGKRKTAYGLVWAYIKGDSL